MIFPDYMTDAERMERIGELLAKGIALTLQRVKNERRPTTRDEAREGLGTRVSTKAPTTHRVLHE